MLYDILFNPEMTSLIHMKNVPFLYICTKTELLEFDVTYEKCLILVYKLERNRATRI